MEKFAIFTFTLSDQNGQKNTTLETRIIPNKKASGEAKFKNGASSGIVLSRSH